MPKHVTTAAALIIAFGPVLARAQDKSAQLALQPSLGLNVKKDLSPIIDEDALIEENKFKKNSPGNEAVAYRRGFHETALLNGFLEGFRDSAECNGITFLLRPTDRKPEFTVYVSVTGHDSHPDDQTWTWMLSHDDASDKSKNGVGGLGAQSSAKLTARDVCLTIWDDIDANHFKKPGGKIE